MLENHQIYQLTEKGEVVCPWANDLDEKIPEEEETDLHSSFSGPLHFLNVSKEETIVEYKVQMDKHIEIDFDARTNVREYLLIEKALAVFVPEKW